MTTTDVLRDLRASETDFASDFVGKILEACPSRRPTSADERRAHEMVAQAYEAEGIEAALEPFRWNENLYLTLALHFGLGAAGTLFTRRAPLLALLLHAGSAVSYYRDSTRKAFALRRLQPFKPSQNVVATLPARGTRRLRIVFVSHGDAAFTGLVFDPTFVKRFASKSGPLRKPLRVAIASLGALAALDIVRMAAGDSTLLRFARGLLTIPPFLSFALNADVVARDTIVPGASDNLSGVVGGLLLAKRFLARRPDDLELVFVTTGCEEAGLGGSQALLEAHRDTWSQEDTVVLTIDGLSGGALHYFTEGEIDPIPTHPFMKGVLDRVIGQGGRFGGVTPFDIPVGGTDVIPWARAGYPALSFGRVDPELHTPRNYHLPSDTLEHFSAEETVESVDFVEAIAREIAAQRLGQS